MKWVLAFAVAGAGVSVAWKDTRPGWDDTGMTAGIAFLVAAAGALAGSRVRGMVRGPQESV